MKRRLHISRSPKKNPKESRWVSANDALKTDPCSEDSGVPSNYSLMLEGLCCQYKFEKDGTMNMEWVSAIRDDLDEKD